MNFDLNQSLKQLGNNPSVFRSLLSPIKEEWLNVNEGEGTWTIKEVLAHLIVCEKTNWLPRIKLILSETQKTFEPMDMSIHLEIAAENTIEELLQEFETLRASNISELASYNLSDTDLHKTGMHPKLGQVRLSEVISTWTTHDLSHLSQILRILAKQNQQHVGGFETYLRILK
ncbi:MAG TPA: DinB family protein [Bacteroidia bacterium]